MATECQSNIAAAGEALRARQRQAAIRIIKSYETGAADESLCAPGWKSWAVGLGHIPREQFRPMLKAFIGLFPKGLALEITDTTVEDGRVSLLAKGHGVLKNGEAYANTYHFFVRFNGEKIIEVMEFLDSGLVARQIMPLIT